MSVWRRQLALRLSLLEDLIFGGVRYPLRLTFECIVDQSLDSVAKSENTLEWTCNTSPYGNFTVLYVRLTTLLLLSKTTDYCLFLLSSIANSGGNVLGAGPEPIVAIQPNYDCSLTITASQDIFPAATGYTVLLANPFNDTDVSSSNF